METGKKLKQTKLSFESKKIIDSEIPLEPSPNPIDQTRKKRQIVIEEDIIEKSNGKEEIIGYIYYILFFN